MADKFVRVVSPDGQLGEIPENLLAGALQDGFTLPDAEPTPSMVQVYDPDGNLGEIPAENLEAARKDGYKTKADVDRAAELERYRSAGNKVLTASEGFIRGASLGFDAPAAALESVGTYLGQKVADWTGDTEGLPAPSIGRNYEEAKREIALREEANPTIAAASEVAGVVAPAIISGGATAEASALAKGGAAVARNTPAGLLSRGTAGAADWMLAKNAAAAAAKTGITGAVERGLIAGAKLAGQGAAEGAVYGASSRLNEALQSGDYDQLADKALAGAAEGAEAGLVLAPVIGGAFWGVGKAYGAMRLAGGKLASATKTARDAMRGKLGAADEAAQAVSAEAEAAARVAQRAELDAAIVQKVDEVSQFAQQVDGDASAEMSLKFEPIYQSMGSLVTRESDHEALSRAAKFAKAAKDAAGGFDDTHQAAVRQVIKDGDEFFKILDFLDTRFMKNAKRRAAEKMDELAEGRPFSSPDTDATLAKLEAGLDDLIDASFDDASQRAALRMKKKELPRLRAQLQKYASEGRVGKYASALDDFKSYADSVADGQQSSMARTYFQGDGEVPGLIDGLRKHLEDANVFGEYAVQQRVVNASLSERIRRSKNDLLRGLTYEGGESAANPYRRLKEVNPDSWSAFFDVIGGPRGASSEKREIAIRKWLRAAEIDAVTRAKAWGTAEAQEAAAKTRALRESMEAGITAVAGARKNKEAWRKLAESADLPIVGGTIKGGLRLGQKVGAWSSRNVQSTTTTGVSAQAAVASEADAAAAAVQVGPTPAFNATRKAAIKADKALQKAPSKFLQRIKDNSSAIERATESGAIMLKVQDVLNQARELADPSSAASQNLQSYLMDLEQDDPGMAMAMQAKLAARVQFLADKAGPEPVNALGMPTQRDPVTLAKLGRYARAVVDPVKAIERVADGSGTEEDRETLQTLNAPLWNEFVTDTMAQFEKTDATYSERIRASLELGIPLDDSMSAESLAYTQSRMDSASEVQAKARGVDMGSQTAQLTSDRLAFARS